MHDQFRKYFEGLKSELRIQSLRASQLKSSTDIGNVREEFCERFLRQFLPNDLLVTSGEVIDSFDHQTGQQDLLIYDPRLLRLGITENTQILLAEGCLAAIEVKSTLDGREFKKVIAKSKEIKRLRPFLSPALPEYGHASYLTNAAEARENSRQFGLDDDSGRVRKYIHPKFYCFSFRGPKSAETLNAWVTETLAESVDAGDSYEEWRDCFPDLVCIMDTGAIYRNDGFAFELQPLVRGALPDGSLIPNDFYFLPTDEREEVGAFAKHLLECSDLRKRLNRLISLGLSIDIDAYFDS